jgi:hypothetical protein
MGAMEVHLQALFNVVLKQSLSYSSHFASWNPVGMRLDDPKNWSRCLGAEKYLLLQGN